MGSVLNVTQWAIASTAVVYLLVCALPPLAFLALLHLITQELFAPTNAWTRSRVIRLTLTVFHRAASRAALGLLHAKRLIVTAEWQARFVSTQEFLVTFWFVKVYCSPSPELSRSGP
jgi:hypothetical protein